MSRLTVFNEWPIPEGDDTPDVPYWLGQLGDAIDGTFDSTGWMDLVPASPFVAQAGLESLQVRRRGIDIELRGGVTNSGMVASGSYFILGVGALPADCRPTRPVVGTGGSSAAAATPQVHVLQDGSVQLRLSATLGAYYKLDRIRYTND